MLDLKGTSVGLGKAGTLSLYQEYVLVTDSYMYRLDNYIKLSTRLLSNRKYHCLYRTLVLPGVPTLR